MREVFADTGFWIAILDPRDALHTAAREHYFSSKPHRIVTTQMVLAELLNGLSGSGYLRRMAARFCEGLLAEPQAGVIPQTPEQFDRALSLYRRREDKRWSLTDCASFVVMDQRGIAEALTFDHHFDQAGFKALLRDA